MAGSRLPPGKAVVSEVYKEYHRAAAEQVRASFEFYYTLIDSWLDVRAYPSPDGLSVFFQDITERKRVEESLAERERTALLGAGLWPTIICQTRDVSERGLGLLVPALRADDENFFGVKGPVQVTLALPTGAVSAKAVAVRFERGQAGAGDFLVCVEITETEGAAAERWVSHVRRCVAAQTGGPV